MRVVRESGNMYPVLRTPYLVPALQFPTATVSFSRLLARHSYLLYSVLNILMLGGRITHEPLGGNVEADVKK
jgi:hypothetical protein